MIEKEQISLFQHFLAKNVKEIDSLKAITDIRHIVKFIAGCGFNAEQRQLHLK